MPHKDKEVRKTYLKSWYARNKKKLGEQGKRYRSSAKGIATRRLNNIANVESLRASRKAWKIRNPEHTKLVVRIRRERIKGAKGNCNIKKWIDRVSYFGWRCVYCNIGLNSTTLVIEHSIPISRGGSNWPSNLVPSCASCNYKKWNQTSLEFGRFRRRA